MKAAYPLLALLALSAISPASVISFNAVGTVTSISDPYALLGATVNINDPVTVTVTYETTDATSPSPFWGGVRYYFTSPSQLMITAMVGTHAVTSSGTYMFLDSWDYTLGAPAGYSYWGGTAGIGVNQLGASFFDPAGTYPTGGLFPTTTLPAILTNGSFVMQYVDNWQTHGAGAIVYGTLVNPNAVTPEPGSIIAISLGVGALLRRRRKES